MTLIYRIVRNLLVLFLSTFWRWRFIDLHKIPSDGPVLIAANHISYFDPFCHAYCVDSAKRVLRIFGKEEVFRIPIAGRILLAMKMIPIRRGSGESGPVEVAIKALNEGGVIVVYPESTITKRPDVLPQQGKTGISRISLAARVPVTPIAIWGSHWVIPPDRKKLRLNGFRKTILLKVGDPMYFDDLYGKQDDAEVRRDVTDRIMKELERMVVELQDLHPMGAKVPGRRP